MSKEEIQKNLFENFKLFTVLSFNVDRDGEGPFATTFWLGFPRKGP